MLGKALIGVGVGSAGLGLGLAGGAYMGKTENNAALGATVGGAAGLGLGIGAVAIGANAGSIASGVGKGALGLGQKAWGFATSEATRNAAIGFAKRTAGVAKVAGARTAMGAGVTAATGSTMALKAGAKYGNIATSMFKVNPSFKAGNAGNMLKMTKTGGAMLGAGTAISAGVSAFKTFDNARAGTSDGQVMTATPVATRSSEMRNAGATGDLAFAMRAQRFG